MENSNIDCVQRFMQIIREENDRANRFTNELYENLRSFTLNDIITLMNNLEEINNQLTDVNFIVRLDVYNETFKNDKYEKIYDMAINRKDEGYEIKNDAFLKKFFYGGICVETFMIKFLNNISRSIESNEFKSSSLDKSILHDLCNIKIDQSKETIKELFKYIKTHFIDDQVYTDTLELLNHYYRNSVTIH